jgi:hypothetical protein
MIAERNELMGTRTDMQVMTERERERVIEITNLTCKAA